MPYSRLRSVKAKASLPMINQNDAQPALTGSVLGVDVGYSPKRRSSAVCRLDWTEQKIHWTIARFRAAEPERAVKAPDQAKAFLMRHADCHHCFLTRAPGKLCLSMSITEPRANSSAPTTAGDRM
jgi:hypothetical protein